jgi:hypothetical protein
MQSILVQLVMARLVPAIHVLIAAKKKDVNARQPLTSLRVCAGQTAMAGHDDPFRYARDC